MTSYLVTKSTDSDQTYTKMSLLTKPFFNVEKLQFTFVASGERQTSVIDQEPATSEYKLF